MKTEQPYWIRQMLGAQKRAETFRQKAKTSRDPKWCIAMARGAEKDASRCFKRWRSENPTAPHPLMAPKTLVELVQDGKL